MNIFNKKILVLAPHTDDAEFGCGATIVKLKEQGNEIFCAAFSACKQSVLSEFPDDILITEVKEASKILGISQENLVLFDYDVRTFSYNRQKILDDIIKLKKNLKPDIIFIPSLNDLHQDHSTIANEAFRAFKFSTVLCYELPWNNIVFSTTFFVELNQKHLDLKIAAISKYKSQQHRPYSKRKFIEALAEVRGTQINKQYAECFEVLRIIL
tara:strand:- start:2401 stop:3036 length:636 start_codon:yes stop_codon:yes gene_type:complete